MQRTQIIHHDSKGDEHQQTIGAQNRKNLKLSEYSAFRIFFVMIFFRCEIWPQHWCLECWLYLGGAVHWQGALSRP